MNEKGRLRWVVVLTGLGSFMAALDTLVVASALNTIQRDLGASLADLEWTVNAYNLSLAVLLVPAAVLGDRLGRARTYAAGLALFALASAGCATAGSVGTLVAMRVVQGASAAVVMTLGLALLSSTFPPGKRGAAVGLFSAVTGVAVACGPLVGGAVIEGLAWHWIFWLNVPVGVVAAPLVLRLVPESRVPDSRLDLPGVALLSGGVLCVVWALVRGEDAGWASAEVLGTAALGVALLAGFAAWQARAPYPLLPPRLLRVRGFVAANLATTLTVAPLFAAVFFYGQLLQVVMGHEPLGAGLRLMAWTGTLLVVAPVAGALGDRIGERPLIVAGLLLQSVAMAWLAMTAGVGSTFLGVLGPFVLGGLGVSMAIPTGQAAAVGTVADRDVGHGRGRQQHGAPAGRRPRHRGHGRCLRRRRRVRLPGRVRGRVPGGAAHRGGPVRPGCGGGPRAPHAPYRPVRGRAGGGGLRGRGAGGVTRRMVTYSVKHGCAEENSAYVHDVMADLEARGAHGLTYEVFLLDDGVTFVHVVEGDDQPILSTEAFQRFASTLVRDRCVGAPAQRTLTLVGRYAG
jgi:EmrB/QacA subfamily drug resistance transporter